MAEEKISEFQISIILKGIVIQLFSCFSNAKTLNLQ